ncbi:MAG TPA: hypothetical protein VF832_14280, partial [Longimicrobiales bacterium]
PASTRMHGRVGSGTIRRIALGALAATALTAVAARAQETPARPGGVQLPPGVEDVQPRLTAPARLGGEPAAIVAARVLAAQSWPVAKVDTARNAMASRWLELEPGPNRSDRGACRLAYRMRVFVLPVSNDTTVVLGAHVWVLEKIGTGAIKDYARNVLVALDQDLRAAAQPASAPRSRLSSVLSYTTGDYIVCGAAR